MYKVYQVIDMLGNTKLIGEFDDMEDVNKKLERQNGFFHVTNEKENTYINIQAFDRKENEVLKFGSLK